MAQRSIAQSPAPYKLLLTHPTPGTFKALVPAPKGESWAGAVCRLSVQYWLNGGELTATPDGGMIAGSQERGAGGHPVAAYRMGRLTPPSLVACECGCHRLCAHAAAWLTLAPDAPACPQNGCGARLVVFAGPRPSTPDEYCGAARCPVCGWAVDFTPDEAADYGASVSGATDLPLDLDSFMQAVAWRQANDGGWPRLLGTTAERAAVAHADLYGEGA